ncbi:Arylsulfotransferase ASST [Aspergillus parasiticus SU-1]|uniref:Arylsulfotransferase ASST n=1 Tax=Aspergillus parasiticus (strain ATCC 56775 / NRRL 5862 / SRRC 143 / SU-1) TaxID=1403190 RepID=A0A0F0ILB6_ASPPU|nr:Arylsulfotransferase ASST [Aspergillus parasiticus SU-1]
MGFFSIGPCIYSIIIISRATLNLNQRPDIRAPVIEVSLKNDSLITPGYIFMAPYETELPGPYIYDTDGNLVWSGADGSTSDIFHDLQVCPYEGSDHLCYFQGNQIEGYARGRNIILNKDYGQAVTVQSGDGLTLSDMHELNIIDNTSVLIAIYQPRRYNLEAYNVSADSGWVMDGVFQEINITTGDVLFEWRSLDHVGISETYTPIRLNPVVGDGLSNATAWDYFHINSVDKNNDGDYLVSARHTSCIYKISGEDGAIQWRLGGTNSSIEMQGYNFSSQHDARFIQENDTTTVISLFDNGSNGYRNTSSKSSGIIVSIDHGTNTSSLMKRYEAPDNGLLSTSQGNLQILANQNTFIGWGSNPSISEHTEDGTPVYFATLNDARAMNYRAFKFNWTGEPSDNPTLRTYAAAPGSATTFWVSWNGATQVEYWNLYGTTSTSEEFTMLSKVDRQGFQTTYTSTDYHPRAYAEALSSDGSSLGNSSVVDTTSSLRSQD